MNITIFKKNYKKIRTHDYFKLKTIILINKWVNNKKPGNMPQKVINPIYLSETGRRIPLFVFQHTN
jgi:hypothetical protein